MNHFGACDLPFGITIAADRDFCNAAFRITSHALQLHETSYKVKIADQFY